MCPVDETVVNEFAVPLGFCQTIVDKRGIFGFHFFRGPTSIRLHPPNRLSDYGVKLRRVMEITAGGCGISLRDFESWGNSFNPLQ
jgi:hypothetical protein